MSREEKVHNITNNNDCIALKDIRILYVDDTVIMMKWIHKMMEWCSCQVRRAVVYLEKHSLVPKSKHSSRCFPLVQCPCSSQ